MLRRLETALAWFNLGFLVLYVPVETWVSWPHGLMNPFYLVDAIAMVLLGWGGWASLRARPRPAPFLLCAGLGWAAANGWRSAAWRLLEVTGGGELERGLAELVAVVGAAAIGCLAFALALYLVVQVQRGGAAGGA